MNRFVLAVVISGVLATSAAAITVQPGLELYMCEPGQAAFVFDGPTTIPQGFFGPGSEPFVGTVIFSGVDISGYAGCLGDFGSTHVILRRTEAADLPAPGTTDQVPLEAVGFSLLSISPIEVTYPGGINELWRVSWEESESSSGVLLQLFAFLDETLLYRNNEIPSRPHLFFLRLSDMSRREIDAGDVQWQSFFDVFTAPGMPWREHADPGEVAQPSCTTNFVGSYNGDPLVTLFTGQHGRLALRPAPPKQPVAARAVSWGAVKSFYR
jgi:hypothetical protein